MEHFVAKYQVIVRPYTLIHFTCKSFSLWNCVVLDAKALNKQQCILYGFCLSTESNANSDSVIYFIAVNKFIQTD